MQKELINQLLEEYRNITQPESMLHFLINNGWAEYATETNPGKIRKAFKHCYNRYVSDIIEDVRQEINREIFK